ncbi:hypothetical protein [Acinetobacter populi]|uniref:Uncharacterized protein n=1 Tax=Acinetobacter populi TaxID=1582270 RepID=A0A1Z9Z2M2_9GAMM|nr:hypothetical protein [Acinetobacter populi]OUY08738.1 hypothetical protein CAP51_03745 [Acinetobacter populi]
MQQNEIDESLKLITASDAKVNLETLIPYIKSKVEDYLAAHAASESTLVLSDLLTKEDYDQNWVIAQCHSILSYIDLFYADHFLNVVKERDLAEVTKEFIFTFKAFNGDLKRLNLNVIYDARTDEMLGEIFDSNYVSAQNAFVTAKMQALYAGCPSAGTAEYLAKLVPFMIRQALELKIKSEMLGIAYAVTKNTDNSFKSKQIMISECIDFLGDQGATFFNLPVEIKVEDLKIINKWSNNFIHTGLHEYSWLVKTAIDVIEPLFSIKENGEISTDGFKFRSEQFNFDSLHSALQSKFGQNVHFAIYQSE